MHDAVAIEPCDILIHAGDYSFKGKQKEVIPFYEWLNKQPAKHKILINGNHEVGFEENPGIYQMLLKERGPNITYLENSSVTVMGLKIWGSPVTPWFYDWAYNIHRGPDIARIWEQIPKDIDILVTHGPPHTILDMTTSGEFVGCEDLYEKIKTLKKLKLHVFGHIHCGAGFEDVFHDNAHPGSIPTRFVNASICDEQYEPINQPIVVNL